LIHQFLFDQDVRDIAEKYSDIQHPIDRQFCHCSKRNKNNNQQAADTLDIVTVSETTTNTESASPQHCATACIQVFSLLDFSFHIATTVHVLISCYHTNYKNLLQQRTSVAITLESTSLSPSKLTSEFIMASIVDPKKVLPPVCFPFKDIINTTQIKNCMQLRLLLLRYYRWMRVHRLTMTTSIIDGREYIL
jgi:hypothetical protein